ncbi:LysR substrate-binding domain-containing protein [Sphingomonas sp. RT2P30]|uniref:LysR family transcriptional regulator n=1 Tax=Parasphingomonas halimpatiens TaxID=3096162 RepID=UPI003B56CC7D
MIDRYLLRYLLAVIDQGNFSRAADACGVSQPTLSVGIAKLERELGRVLLRRTSRRVELTEAGAHFAAHARRIEAEFLVAERAADESPGRATFRLGVLATIPTPLIEAVLIDLRRAGATTRLELVEASERDLNERLARGRVDAAVTILRGERDRSSAMPLFTEGYALAMAADHPLAHLPVIAPGQLADNVMIVRRHCELLSETSRYFTSHGVRPFFAARTTSEDRALALVRRGLGVTVMPDSFRHPGVVRPALVDFTFTRTIGIVPAAHADSAAFAGSEVVQALLRTLKEPVVSG